MVKSKTAVALVVVAVIAFAAGVFVGPTVMPTPSKTFKPAIIRTDFLVGGKHVGFYVALDKGFYAQESIQATVEGGRGSVDTTRLVDAGKATMGFADISVTISSRSKGSGVRQVGMIYGRNPQTFIFYCDVNIKTPKDIEGKTMLIQPGAAQEVTVPVFFKINNMDPSKIKITPIAIPQDLPAAMERKVQVRPGYWASDVDTMIITAKRQNMGEFCTLDFADWGMDLYTNGLIATDELIKKDPDLVRGLVRATMRGYAYAFRNFDESVDIMLKYNPGLDKDITTLQAKKILESIASKEAKANFLGWMDTEKTKKTVDLFNDALKTSVKAEDVYTNQFLDVKVP